MNGGDSLDSFMNERKASYDKLAKRFLARKPILAQILKYSVREFADCSLEDIEQKYIEGDPTLTINTVPLDDTLDIKGRNAESGSPNEGVVTFDIIFDAYVPTTGESVKIIINIEPQKTTVSLDYKLMKRAVYYAARLISSQKEKEFTNDDYNKLKKIYSIWVCMNVQNYRADSIQEYRLTENVLHGKFKDEFANYDLIDIIILNLGKKTTTHKLLNLLHLIFMDLKTSSEKEKILREDYDLKITRDMGEEVSKMGGLMEPLLEIAAEQAAAESKKETLLDTVRSAIKNWNLTPEDAMNGLDISPELQKELKPLI